MQLNLREGLHGGLEHLGIRGGPRCWRWCRHRCPLSGHIRQRPSGRGGQKPATNHVKWLHRAEARKQLALVLQQRIATANIRRAGQHSRQSPRQRWRQLRRDLAQEFQTELSLPQPVKPTGLRRQVRLVRRRQHAVQTRTGQNLVVQQLRAVHRRQQDHRRVLRQSLKDRADARCGYQHRRASDLPRRAFRTDGALQRNWSVAQVPIGQLGRAHHGQRLVVRGGSIDHRLDQRGDRSTNLCPADQWRGDAPQMQHHTVANGLRVWRRQRPQQWCGESNLLGQGAIEQARGTRVVLHQVAPKTGRHGSAHGGLPPSQQTVDEHRATGKAQALQMHEGRHVIDADDLVVLLKCSTVRKDLAEDPAAA